MRLNMRGTRCLGYALCMMVIVGLSPEETRADSEVTLSRGQTVYVSVYSNVQSGPKAIPTYLAGMLSVRNTDPRFLLIVTKADYFDSTGKLIRSYIKEPVKLKPLESILHYIQEQEKSGGPGANFIVKWRSSQLINKPIIESIMTETRAGISFRCPGQVILEHAK